MALDLVDYEQKAREAVKAFWGNREAARQKQIEAGIKANGLAHAEIHQNRAMRRPRHNQCWHLNAYRVARPQ